MSEINLITKETDLTSIRCSKLTWDMEVKGVPYQVVRLPDFIHSIGGKVGDNDYWAYPRSEEMTFENLREVEDPYNAVRWGLLYRQNAYLECKHDEPSIRTGEYTMITRNDKPFLNVRGTMVYSLPKATALICECKEHPLELCEYEFDKKMIGRRVWWNSEPGRIARFVGGGQACVIIEPDGMEQFTLEARYDNDEDRDIFSEYLTEVKTSIFDQHIDWFRD